ncbi:MAG: ubiquinone/menaquinone biosynthesis methyltransferase [Candidatus Hydrothermarchaeales archaeon]
MEEMAKAKKARYIHRMFTDLSERYDQASPAIALGRDGYWRDYTASFVEGVNGRILDACCGTGKLSIRLLEKTKSQVVAVDFCEKMVEKAKKKYGDREGLSIGIADVEKLPFPNETFACVTVAFGLRNVKDIPRAISEMLRVLEKGGKIIILDLGKPSTLLFRRVYYSYFYSIVPLFGGFIAGKGKHAYRYLPHSLTHFPSQNGLERIMKDLGLNDIKIYNLDRGIVAIHVGAKSR